MNRPMTTEDVRDRLELHREPLDGIHEKEYQWDLGQVTISKKEPIFRVGYWEPLNSDSRFYKRPFDFGPTSRGTAAIFQVFDPMSSTPGKCEYLVGWVPPEREADLDRWIAFLNTEIAKRVSPARNGPIQLGVFKELGYDDDPTAPSLASVRGKRRADHKAEVLAYLRRGRTTAFSPGIKTDVFDPSKLAETLSVMTDGTYEWPELLAYYVEHYDVALPEEFEEHMRNNLWQVPRST
jgi:hypothetical protein